MQTNINRYDMIDVMEGQGHACADCSKQVDSAWFAPWDYRAFVMYDAGQDALGDMVCGPCLEERGEVEGTYRAVEYFLLKD